MAATSKQINVETTQIPDKIPPLGPEKVYLMISVFLLYQMDANNLYILWLAS